MDLRVGFFFFFFYWVQVTTLAALGFSSPLGVCFNTSWSVFLCMGIMFGF